jgi:hypothetical protein
MPDGIEKVPTRTSPVGKISVSVPVMGAVLCPARMLPLMVPAAENTAFPMPPIVPVPTTPKLEVPINDAFPEREIVAGTAACRVGSWDSPKHTRALSAKALTNNTRRYIEVSI